MAKHKKAKKHAEPQAAPAIPALPAAEPGGPGGPGGPLKEKEYQRRLKTLHVELVNLQRWVTETGKKVCIIFEGRDGAGKGGVIKALTERVSPRVFRVVALPAPTEREK